MTDPEFHFDFGSPNAYLAYCVLPEIEQRTGRRFRHVPVLLGGLFKATGNRSPMETFAGVRNKMEYQTIEMRRFIARHKLDRFHRNPHFPVNTLMLMRAAVAEDRDGDLPRFEAAAFHHMWEDPKKMDDPDVFRAAFDASGLDGAALLARGQDPAVKQALLDNTNAAVARGSFGSPTFFVGEEIFFGKDRLREVEEAIAAG